MKKALVWFIIINFSSGAFAESTISGFDEFEFFDRELIMNSRIAELRFTISKHKKEENVDESSHSCIVYTSLFDRKGNLTREDLNRAGSYNYYRYDDDGRLYDWGWEDKSSGKIDSIAQAIKSEDKRYERERVEREMRLSSMLKSRIDYRYEVVREIQDICYSIDAIYEITHKKSGLLPKEGIAIRRSETVRKTMLNKKSQSDDVLFLYYDYVFHE